MKKFTFEIKKKCVPTTELIFFLSPVSGVYLFTRFLHNEGKHVCTRWRVVLSAVFILLHYDRI